MGRFNYPDLKKAAHGRAISRLEKLANGDGSQWPSIARSVQIGVVSRNEVIPILRDYLGAVAVEDAYAAIRGHNLPSGIKDQVDQAKKALGAIGLGMPISYIGYTI